MALSAWAEAQRAVIGSLMIQPDQWAGEVFQRAKPAHFGDASLRHIFETSMGLWSENRPIDPISVSAACGSDKYGELIRKCMLEMPTAENLPAWLDICAQQARLAALQSEAMQILSNDATEETAIAAYERMGQLLRGTEDIEDLTLTELIGDYIDRMRDPSPPDYLSWGIEKLDTTLAISAGKFVILAADSSVGKTALALQFAYHMAATGKRVGFFSIETDKESIADRLMAERQIAAIPLPATKKKKLADYDFERAGLAGVRSDSVPLRIIRRAETVEKIRARTIMRKFDVIFIDYVQLIDAPGKERWDIVTRISMSLHRMAQQLGVTVIGLSQITPPGKGSKQAPTKDDIRESRQLKQDADAILILSVSDSADDPPNTRVLDVAKNKDGMCGKMKLRFEPQFMTFTQLVTTESLQSEGKAAKSKRKADAMSGGSAPKNVPGLKSGAFTELPDDGQEELPF